MRARRQEPAAHGVCAHCHQKCSPVLRCPPPCGTPYCGKACQRQDWKAGGHKAVCAGRVQRYPIQKVVNDAMVTVCRSPLLYLETAPEENVLACIVMDTLVAEESTYKISMARGAEDCQTLIDVMKDAHVILPGGENHALLIEHFGATAPPSQHGAKPVRGRGDGANRAHHAGPPLDEPLEARRRWWRRRQRRTKPRLLL